MDVSSSAASPDLIAAIYDAVLDPSARLRWVMETFAAEVSCDAAYFKMVDRSAGVLVVGVGGGLVEGSDRDYLDNYLATDVRVPRVDRAPRRVILRDGDLISVDEWRRSAFHHEWLPRYGLQDLVHVNISPSARYTAIVTCAQSPERGPFSARQIAVFAAYVPHFERAAELQIRLAQLGDQTLLMEHAFDRLTVASVILDAGRGVVFANAAAREMFAEADGLGTAYGRLLIADPVAAASVAQRCRAVDPGFTDRGGSGRIRIGRPSGASPYEIEILPLPAANGIYPGAAAVVAFIYDHRLRGASREKTLRAVYGLTPAEAALAEAVAGGSTLREYAEGRGRSVGTARYQMKQVLGKTGCRRQSDLVRLLARFA